MPGLVKNRNGYKGQSEYLDERTLWYGRLILFDMVISATACCIFSVINLLFTDIF